LGLKPIQSGTTSPDAMFIMRMRNPTIASGIKRTDVAARAAASRDGVRLRVICLGLLGALAWSGLLIFTSNGFSSNFSQPNIFFGVQDSSPEITSITYLTFTSGPTFRLQGVAINQLSVSAPSLAVPSPHRRCWSARSHLGGRWLAGLVATPASADAIC
jgi:hypothetical protein